MEDSGKVIPIEDRGTMEGFKHNKVVRVLRNLHTFLPSRE
jgi:hypothetical protein